MSPLQEYSVHGKQKAPPSQRVFHSSAHLCFWYHCHSFHAKHSQNLIIFVHCSHNFLLNGTINYSVWLVFCITFLLCYFILIISFGALTAHTHCFILFLSVKSLLVSFNVSQQLQLFLQYFVFVFVFVITMHELLAANKWDKSTVCALMSFITARLSKSKFSPPFDAKHLHTHMPLYILIAKKSDQINVIISNRFNKKLFRWFRKLLLLAFNCCGTFMKIHIILFIGCAPAIIVFT